MSEKRKLDILNDDLKTVLIRLTLPMIMGILGMVAFNLSDAYFIGKLGTIQMAAVAFTFPVVLIINSLIQGIGIGASSVISRAVGAKDYDRIKRLVTDSLLLGLIVAMVALLIGELTIEPLFGLLGADAQVMPYIKSYMQIWYAGALFVVIPMVGNNAIRALGDTKIPGLVMGIAAILNIIMDPILIFGLGPIPSLGVSGAALATMFARMITFCVSMYVLAIREKVIVLKRVPFSKVLASWKAILYIGVPNALAKMVLPIGAGVITGLIATMGHNAVAGYGIATRIEVLLMAILQALASIIPIFIGQHFGAGKFERIRRGIRMSTGFAFVFSIGIYGLLLLGARPLASLFTDQVEVINVIVLYLRIVPIAYGFYGILQILNGAYNALHQPVKASLINLSQVLVVYVPLALILVKQFELQGIFAALAISYILVGLIAIFIWRGDMIKQQNR